MNRRVTRRVLVGASVVAAGLCATSGAAPIVPPPAGQAALAVSVAVQHGAVVLVGADGTGVRVLATGGPAQQLVDPAWSPNGRTLAFTTTQPARGRAAAGSTIFLEALPAGRIRALTARLPGRRDDDAAFSPNGARVAFARASGGVSRIMVVSSNFGPPAPLTSGRSGGRPAQDSDPAWSPDGRLIAFTRQVGATPSIWVMGTRGANPHRIVGNGRAPTWAPDSRHIAFVSARDRHGRCGPRFCGELYIARANGRVQRRMTSTILNEADPAWSPDGALIAYARGGGGGQPASAVYTLATVGTCPFRVTGSATVSQPAWRPHLKPPNLLPGC